jgi:hypothetical protein
MNGELGLETDTKQFKMGDGTTAWNALGYAQKGPQGDRGYDFQYTWDGTQLGVKSSDEAEYTYVDLKGATGETGAQGVRGFDFQYTWNGTQLGVKHSDEQEYTYVNLKGEKGDKGDQGVRGYDFQYAWEGTLLGVKSSDEEEYEYVDLKGTTGDKGDKGDPGDPGPAAGSFGVSIDGAGQVITTGVKQYIVIPFACTITGWHLVGSPAGSAVIDIWKKAGVIPTASDSIAGSEKPSLSSAAFNSETNLTMWTTSVVAGDIVAFNVDSCVMCKTLTLTIAVMKQEA